MRAIGLVLLSIAITALLLTDADAQRRSSAQGKRAQSARPQQGSQSSERPGYYHGYPLSDWYRDSLSSY
jgi:hypothetical protein